MVREHSSTGSDRAIGSKKQFQNRPIPYARQSISEEDIAAVADVLRSDFLTQGPAVESFEKAVAAYCGAKYAVAVNSATSGLHIACMAAGLKEGGTLWTSPNTFAASANAGLYCGAKVDFVDIDPVTYNMSADALEEKLRGGPPPDVLIPVHFAGQSCDMKRIRALSKQYGFKVIEDAAHAVGGTYGGGKIGSCAFSDMAVLSFHPVKIITTGEGGMVLTDDPETHRLLLRLRAHGITRDAALMDRPDEGAWFYEQRELGFNYRMPDILAALGRSQLARIETFVARRHELAARYHKAFEGSPVTAPAQLPELGRSALHLYPVQVGNRRAVFEAMRAAGILVNVHYVPVYLHPYYRGLGFKEGLCPEAEKYYSRALSLPMYYGLSDEDQDTVAGTLLKIVQ